MMSAKNKTIISSVITSVLIIASYFLAGQVFVQGAQNYTITLYPGGVNFISLPLQPVNTAIEVVLQPIAGMFSHVYGYNNDTKNWLLYFPEWGLKELSTMEGGKSYFIYNVTQQVNLTITGTPLSWTVTDWLNLLNESAPAGTWNMLGCPFLTSTPIKNVNFGLSYGQVARCRPGGGSCVWQYYYSGSQSGDFTTLDPGVGYQIKIGPPEYEPMIASVTFTVTDEQSGAKISGAVVSVSGFQTGTCTTDSTGTCVIGLQKSQSYSAWVDGPGYACDGCKKNFTLPADLTYAVALTLKAFSGVEVRGPGYIAQLEMAGGRITGLLDSAELFSAASIKYVQDKLNTLSGVARSVVDADEAEAKSDIDRDLDFDASTISSLLNNHKSRLNTIEADLKSLEQNLVNKGSVYEGTAVWTNSNTIKTDMGIWDWGVFKRRTYVYGNIRNIYALDGSIAKTFEINHPTKKDKKLVHAAIEGPELAVFYRGEAQLVENEAMVELPEYFEALTRKEGRTVFLTPKFEFGEESFSALAAFPVKDGKFKVIATDRNNPSQKFYWEVKAVRADVEPLKVETSVEEWESQRNQK